MMTPIDVLENTSERPLTRSQLSLWTGQKIHDDVPLYNMALAFELAGRVDVEAFSGAFDDLVESSDAMRSVIVERQGFPVQVEESGVPRGLEVVDLRSEADPAGHARTLIEKRTRRMFRLDEQLFDSALYLLGPECIWFLNQHHLITDGWSVAVTYARMSELYERRLGEEFRPASPCPRYADYVTYESEFRESEQFTSIAGYWEAFENDSLSIRPLSLYARTSTGESTSTSRYTVELGIDRTERLKELALDSRFRALTPHLAYFNLFATVLAAYLHRVADSDRIIFGTPSHNRPRTSFKETIGLFIELFPFRADIDEDDTFATLYSRVRTEANNFLRFAQPGAGSPASHRTFNVVLNYIPATFPPFAGIPVRSEWVHAGHGDGRHHLRVQVEDFDRTGGFHLHFDFKDDLLDPAAARRAVDHFLNVFDGLVADPERPVAAVPLVSPPERRWLLNTGSGISNAISDRSGILRRFLLHVRERPEIEAVKSSGGSLTYAELDERSEVFASRLRRRGAVPGDRAVVCLTRSEDAIVAIFGALRSGVVFIPVDANTPARRLEFVIEDSGARFLVRDGESADGDDDIRHRVIRVDTIEEDTRVMDAAVGMEQPGTTDPAYVIYTSGSTGTPKGVVISRGSLDNYIEWASAFYFDDRSVTFPLFTSLSVDLTLTSLFVPLVTGGRVIIIEGDDAPADVLERAVSHPDVNAVKMTPSHALLLDRIEPSDRKTLTLIFGGENLTTAVARRMTRLFGEATRVFNEYGPTECTVGCTVHRFDPSNDVGESVPVGRPAAGARAYVFDREGNLVPPGVAGELCIAGPGLSEGYLGRPELTRERFVPNRFDGHGRIYRTGDVVRWIERPDGLVLEYMGRTDEQIKIRGTRVEPAEVEQALLAHPDVSGAYVMGVATSSFTPADVYCTRCGLASNYPGISFDSSGVCNVCRSFDEYEEKAHAWFGAMSDLRSIFDASRRAAPHAPYDCLMLLSGGKDSSYALARLVDMGLNVLTFTLDNGFISEEAKANIKRVTDALGVDHVFGSTPAMNTIFVDSLKRFSNVCNGCFKTIYTLATNLADEKGIPVIVTGLSRGQFFETRLTKELFEDDDPDSERIDLVVLEARKAYHRVDDAVSRHLDVGELQHGDVFDRIRFVDFYRYCDASLDEMMSYLDERLPWIRPSDTGRSTNCLINDAGIFVHKKERGYHNYAFPYSWDVRVGHKTRREALEELDDQIDEQRVRRMLNEIGYDPDHLSATDRRLSLVAYFTGTADPESAALRQFLAERLPAAMIPAHFIRLETIPLNTAGKVDRSGLPRPGRKRTVSENPSEAPATPDEKTLARIWSDVLQMESVGVHENFFDLGGESILAIQITARATEAGLNMPAGLIFRYQTIAELAEAARAGSGPAAAQGPVTGPIRLSPIQRWFFDHETDDHDHWNQYCIFETAERIGEDIMLEAASALLLHHDMLRARFRRSGGRWTQRVDSPDSSAAVDVFDVSDETGDSLQTALSNLVQASQERLSIVDGPMIRFVIIRMPVPAPDRLLVVAHHLVIDAISWSILIEDLNRALQCLRQGDSVVLPPKTTSFKSWSESQYDGDESVPGQSGSAPSPEETPKVSRSGPDQPRHSKSVSKTLVLDPADLDPETSPVVRSEHSHSAHGLLAVVALALVTATRDGVRIHVEGHGRDLRVEGINVSRTIGWFTTLDSIRLDAGVRTLHDALEIVTSVRGSTGSTADVAGRGDPYSESADLLFNYLGEMNRLTGSQDGVLRPIIPICLSKSPGFVRRYPLEVNVWIDDRGLVTTFEWCPDALETCVVEAVIDTYRKRVPELATLHDPRDGTGTEFPLADLDSDDLRRLESVLRQIDAEQG